jgi:hypothetical protein
MYAGLGLEISVIFEQMLRTKVNLPYALVEIRVFLA